MGSARPIICTVKPSPSLQCANYWLIRPLADTNKNGTARVFCKVSWGACYCMLSVANSGDCAFWNKRKNGLEQQILAFLLSSLKCWIHTKKQHLWCCSDNRMVFLSVGESQQVESWAMLPFWEAGLAGTGGGLGPGVGHPALLPAPAWWMSKLFTEKCVITTVHSNSVWREMVTRLPESTRLDISRHSWVLGYMMVGNIMGNNCPPS